MILSKDFTLKEMLESTSAEILGITEKQEAVPEEAVCNLIHLCHEVLQPLRDNFKEVIRINSGYRCPELNKWLGGAPNSQHLKGEAVDIFLWDKQRGKEYFYYIIEHTNFDQLIWEQRKNRYWIHVSAKRQGENRHQVLFNINYL